MNDPIGSTPGTQVALHILEDTDTLDPIDTVPSISTLLTAIRDLSIPHILSPPHDTINKITEIYRSLPPDAKPHYQDDERLRTKINTARSQFNTWKNRRQRKAELLSPIEAGYANYPYDKARRLHLLEQDARDDLAAAIDRINAAAGGAHQRALQAIGSSIRETTEQRRATQREAIRERLSPGTRVQFRNPEERTGHVVRVNTKTVRVAYPNPLAGGTCPITGDDQPDELEDRIQLDSEYLEILDDHTTVNGTEGAAHD